MLVKPLCQRMIELVVGEDMEAQAFRVWVPPGSKGGDRVYWRRASR